MKEKAKPELPISETNEGSANVAPPTAQDAAAASSVPESEEVKQARLAQERRQRKDDLDEAAKIIGTDVRNSADQVAFYAINDNETVLKEQLARMYDRMTRAHGLLARHIDNLPTCSIVNPAKEAPTA